MKKKRKGSLAGTGLYQHHQNLHYYYRRQDPITGKRTPVDLGLRIDEALRRAAELDKEHQARLEGRPTEDSWDLELAPLIERWLSSQPARNPRTGQNRRMRILRVVTLLGLTRTGDLRRVAAIDDRLRAIPDQLPQNLRRGFQEPLRKFSAWLAENQRVLDRDPLLCWKPIPFEHVHDSRRSVLPLEYAGALTALDYLGASHGHEVSQRPLFTTLLVTGARVGAVTSRLIRHLDRRGSRIDLGPSVGKKRRGAGILDPRTRAQVEAEIGGRTESEPLFRGPRGGEAQDPNRARDLWLQAISLSIVDDLWPSHARRDLTLALQVSRSLIAGTVQVGVQGNPRIVTQRRRDEVAATRLEVGGLVELLGDDWRARQVGLVLASIRKTHHTWARVLGVPGPCIDKQLGHSSHGADGADVIQAIAGSRTGTRHYLDMRSSLIDPGRSAQAVRDRLDEAEVELRALPRSLLADWARTRTSLGGASAS